jgi:hypothetical protein
MISKIKWYAKQAWRVVNGDVKDNDEFLVATYPIHDGKDVHNYPIVNNAAEALSALENEEKRS